MVHGNLADHVAQKGRRQHDPSPRHQGDAENLGSCSIAFAARTQSFNRPLSSTVEIDETFIGGKEKNKHANKRQNAGRGTVGKSIVFGALERNGEFRAFHFTSLRGVKAAVEAHVKEGSIVLTDEFSGYQGLGKTYYHKTVNHSSGEYSRAYYFHINSIEGAWSHIKRQIYGIHHWISDKHLGNYLSEMTWRYNRRDVQDGDRMNEFFGRVDGRLTYKALIAWPPRNTKSRSTSTWTSAKPLSGFP